MGEQLLEASPRTTIVKPTPRIGRDGSVKSVTAVRCHASPNSHKDRRTSRIFASFERYTMGTAVALGHRLESRLRVLRWHTPPAPLRFWGLALLLDRARRQLGDYTLSIAPGKTLGTARLRSFSWLTTQSVAWASYLRVHQKRW